MIDFKRLSEDLDRQRAEHYANASPEERARIDEARREREEDEKRPRARVRAIRTNRASGTEKEVEIVLVARPGSGPYTCREIWVYVEEGGPTGYESIPLVKLDEAIAEDKPWAACFGTAGRWDGLEVPVESLRIAREILTPHAIRELGLLVLGLGRDGTVR